MPETETKTDPETTTEPESKETPETTPDPPKGPDGKPFDPERAQRAIEAARAAEKKAKAEAKEAKEKAEKYDQLTEEQKSDLDKANDRAEKAEAKAAEADAKLERANLLVELAKPELGIVNASAAAKLIEGVEYDDDGNPTNLGDPSDDYSLIGKFLSDNPYLKGTPAKPPAPSTDAREGGDEKPPELTAVELEMAKKAGMTPEEYAAYKGADNLAAVEQAGLTKQDTDKS